VREDSVVLDSLNAYGEDSTALLVTKVFEIDEVSLTK